jgi:hypothetical protein
MVVLWNTITSPAMARNSIQFQKGLSLLDFQRLYGTEEHCLGALEREQLLAAALALVWFTTTPNQDPFMGPPGTARCPWVEGSAGFPQSAWLHKGLRAGPP